MERRRVYRICLGDGNLFLDSGMAFGGNDATFDTYQCSPCISRNSSGVLIFGDFGFGIFGFCQGIRT